MKSVIQGITYYGDPKNSCFYNLKIDYQFPFNLTQAEDKYYTAINFKNVPTKSDVDVDFAINNCSVPAKVRHLQIKIKYLPFLAF